MATLDELRLNAPSVRKRSLVFENNPGCRNRSFVGARHFKHLNSAHVVSKELTLMHMGDGERSYWTLVTKEGKTKQLSPELKKLLDMPVNIPQFKNLSK